MRCSTLLPFAAVMALVGPVALAEPAAAPVPAPAATTPAPAPAPTTATPPPPMSPAAQAAVDQRIRTLRADLKITPAEAPLWDSFAQAMRENAARTDALFAERARGVATMNAAENMRSYAQIARDYADSTERLATAFATLYGSLSEPQRQAADKLFRAQAKLPAARPTRRR